MTSNISFFIPAYNCAATIEESVNSIMETNFAAGDELVIVNDFSTDYTTQVLENLKAKYPNIITINHCRNKGGAAARNTGVEHAKNGLLFCLDSDNVLEKNSISGLKEFLVEQHADIASFKSLRYFSKTTDNTDEVWSFEPGVFTIQDLLSGKNAPGASGNYLFTKESWTRVNGYTEDLGALDTWSFGFKQLIGNCKMVVMPDGYYFHRRGHESYFLRDAWNRRKSISLRLIKLIINYVDLINADDVDYIFSKKGRYTWFSNLKNRPIRLATKAAANSVWQQHEFKQRLLRSLRNKVKFETRRILQILAGKIIHTDRANGTEN